jgi:hypothetical protein
MDIIDYQSQTEILSTQQNSNEKETTKNDAQLINQFGLKNKIKKLFISLRFCLKMDILLVVIICVPFN